MVVQVMLRRISVGLVLLLTGAASHAATATFEIRPGGCANEKAYAEEVGTKLKDPILKVFHRVLMDNELNAGCGALQLTDAQMASNENGFSFGLSQFDLATRPGPSMKALLQVISCAEAELGSPLLTSDDLIFLKKYGKQPAAQLKTKPAVWGRFAVLRDPIERALGTTCGRDLLAVEYEKELKSFLPSVNKLVSTSLARNAGLAPAKDFLRLYALDLKNVLGGVENFQAYLAGARPAPCNGPCKSGLVLPFTVKDQLGLTDVIRYVLMATCYGYVPETTRRFDAIRRLDRVLAEIDIETLPLSDRDKIFLAIDLGDMLATTKAAKTNASFAHLEKLVRRASPNGSLPGTATSMTKKKLQDTQKACTKT